MHWINAVPYRARQIVELAAAKATTVKDLLLRDPDGFWAKKAIELLDESAADAARLNLSTARVNDECATMLAFLALEGTLRREARHA